jgi:dihydrofolate reductase
MAKLVVTEFITLDGVIEAPGGGEAFEQGGWAFKFNRGDDGDKFKFDELMASEAQLLGRVTYVGFARAWPSMPDTGEFGEKMNGMPKYVVSNSLQSADWNNSTVIRGDVAAEIAALKQEPGGDLLVAGSNTLVDFLRRHDLVDEYRLMVFPIVLGAGKKLFAEGEMRSLKLVETKPAGEVVILRLEPARA